MKKLDSNKISAQYRDGILHLNLPKKEGAQRLFKTIEDQISFLQVDH